MQGDSPTALPSREGGTPERASPLEGQGGVADPGGEHGAAASTAEGERSRAPGGTKAREHHDQAPDRNERPPKGGARDGRKASKLQGNNRQKDKLLAPRLAPAQLRGGTFISRVIKSKDLSI